MRHNFGSNVVGEVFGESNAVLALARLGRVSVAEMWSAGRGQDKRRREVPNKEAVEVKVRPFLCLPPVVLLTIELIPLHRTCWGSFGNSVEQDGAPADIYLLFTQVRAELQLQKWSAYTNANETQR